MSSLGWSGRVVSWTLALLFVSIAAGCETPSVAPQTGSAELRVTLPQSLSPADVRGVRVEVRGPGIVTPLTTELTQVGGVWQGTVADIPAGTDRVIEGFAYDAASVVIYKGSTGALTIASDATLSVNLVLQPVNPPVPYENEAPQLDSLAVSANQVRPSGSITLSATAHDANGDALSYSWTASAGTFSAPSSASTSWTAPATEGVQLLRLQVTDSRGTSTSASIEVLVQRDGATGGAQVTIGFNTWPQVNTMQATPSTLALGKTTNLSATAVDPDGDALSYAWMSDCFGRFSDPTSATPSFTLEALQLPTSRCSFRVTVTDSKAGQSTGLLVLQVGSGPVINVAPRVDSVFLSSPLAGPGELVTMGLAAHDPDGKPVSFTWSAASGTIRATRWTSTAGEADWMAPACFDAPLSIVATVTDADGGSTQQAFTVSPRENAKCGALAVSGVRNTHHIQADGSVLTVPADLSTFTLGAWVPTADGSGYEYRAGTGLANGTFVIPNVERLPFFLRVNSGYFWVNSRTVDLSTTMLGRPDVAQEPTGTQLTFAIDGLAPWQDTDDLQLHSTNVGLSYFTLGCANPYDPPEAGITSFTKTIDYTLSMRNCGNVPARFEPARGDFLYANQLVSRVDLGTGIPTGVNVQELRRSARIAGPVSSGGPLVLTGTLEPVPTAPQAIAFQASHYGSLALAANPSGTLAGEILYISTLPRYSEYGQYAGIPDLAFVDNPQPGQGNLTLSLEYGNPYPSHWQRMVTAQATVSVPFAATRADGTPATTRWFSAATSSQMLLQDGSWPTLSPRVGPPTNVRINGLETTGTLTGVGETPLVSWMPPTLGTPSRYQVTVYELVATSFGSTTRVSTAGFSTTQTQLRLPPGVLVAGKSYYLQLRAIYEPGYNPSMPYRFSPDYDYGTTLTAKFQP